MAADTHSIRFGFTTETDETGRGGITLQGGNMNRTAIHFDWQNGHTKARRLTRSFDTADEAERFAKDKQVTDIYKINGRYKVEWIKTEVNRGRNSNETH